MTALPEVLEKLESCPFCGKEAATLTNTREMNRPSSCFMYTVVCDATQDGCGATVGYEFEASDAITAWNTRPALLRDAGDGWRSIESAPRDGTRIILGRPDEDGDGGGISVCGYWIDELEDGVDYMGNDGGFTDVDYQAFQPGRSFGAESYRYAGKQPTHWRPLPQAPRAAMAALGD